MNSISPSGRSVMDHESVIWFESETLAGVRFRIARISVGRRIELGKKIREIGGRLEFLNAGNETREKLEAIVLAGEIDRAYLEWGLCEVQGLTVDGEAATPATVIDKGPIDLADEILRKIKNACGLSENEIKN